MTSNEQVDYPLGPSLELLRELAAVSHALERSSQRMKRALGVTAQQRVVLSVVRRYPGITTGRVARLLHVDAGTMTATVDRLERRGLVRRERDARDRRRVILGLSAAGRDLLGPGASPVESALESVLRDTPTGDIVTVRAFLARLAESLASDGVD